MQRPQRATGARPRLRSVSVQDELKQRIDRGELPAGTRLPSEPELAAELQVSRATLREALRAMELEGLLRRRQGSGTFVAEHPRSRELFERARQVMPGGVPMSWMVKWPGPFPVFVSEATGAHFRDVDGHDPQALEVITRDPQVKSIFFNIFGGITRCDEVARGILQALEQMQISLPIVVRLDGTNAEQGRKMLADAPHPKLVTAETMLGAAEKAVELAHGGEAA